MTSFSFPRLARADFFFFSFILNNILVTNALYCPLDVFWGCGYTSGGPSAPTTSSAPPAQPTATLSAERIVIDRGESVTLTWNSTNVTSCSAAGGGVWFPANGGVSGSTIVGPLTSTKSYQITCTSSGVPVDSNIVTVTVRVPVASINATPDRVVIGGGGGSGGSGSGGTTNVSWNVTNVNSCTITKNGVIWKDTLPADVSRTVFGSATTTISSQTSFVITCTNDANSSAVAARASKIVNIVSTFKEF